MSPHTLFRSMRPESDGLPRCGPSARTLGVRVPRDVEPDDGGLVHPGTGGLSVAPDNPHHLPPHRRPRSLNGTGIDPVFELAAPRLPSSLAVRRDSPTHALIEPAHAMDLDAYQRALCDTRSLWSPVP